MTEPARAKPPPSGEGYMALVRAVPRVVARSGFRGLTHREVAREAGVTYGLVGYHFGSREALIQAAAFAATKEAIEESDLTSATGQIEDFASTLSRLVVEESDAQAFQYELVFEARRASTPALIDAVRKLYEEYFEAVSEALSKFGIAHDSAMARIILAALDGITLQQLIFDDPGKTNEAVDTLHEVLHALQDRQS